MGTWCMQLDVREGAVVTTGQSSHATTRRRDSMELSGIIPYHRIVSHCIVSYSSVPYK